MLFLTNEPTDDSGVLYMLVGEQYVDSSKIFYTSSSGEFRKSSIDDEYSLSGCVTVCVGNDICFKLPDNSGNGEEVESEAKSLSVMRA